MPLAWLVSWAAAVAICLSSLSAAPEADKLEWPDAQQYGLSPKLTQQVYEMLTSVGSKAVEARAGVFKKQGDDIVPFLMHLIEKGEVKVQADGKGVDVSREQVLMCLALTRDPRGSDFLVARADIDMPKQIRTYDAESDFTHWTMVLGWSAGEKALDRLFRLQSAEYWNGPDAPVVDIAPPQPVTDAERKSRNENSKKAFRIMALKSIALSGTPRALEAFATGKGIATDLTERIRKEHRACFDTAAAVFLGYCEPPVTEDLTPKQVAAMEELFRKYGQTYSPVLRDPHWKTMSPPDVHIGTR